MVQRTSGQTTTTKNESDKLMADRIYKLRQMPTSIVPRGAPVLIAGGVAMKKIDGYWYSGMEEPAFTRKLNWKPEWWAAIPSRNDPLLPKVNPND